MKKIFYCFLSVMGLLCYTACGHREETHEHEHHHDSEKLTAYSANYELYAEITPMIVGEDCDILAHLTSLEDFKPVTGQKVTLVVKTDGTEQRLSLEKPQQPGIYTFELTPEKAGCASLTFLIGASEEKIGFPHVHILGSHDEHHHHEGEAHHHEESAPANTVTFTKEQSWKIDFATMECQPAIFGSIIRTSAQIMPSQGNEREVTAQTSGIVTYSGGASTAVFEGAQVSDGQRLMSIESNGMADNNMAVRYQEALSDYEQAKADYERKQGLAEDKIVSQTELQRAKAQYETAKAVYDNLKGNFSQNGAVVKAPLSGYITRIYVKNGSYVEAGQHLATISQNRDLYLRCEVQPRYFEQLKGITSATIITPAENRAYSLEELEGSVMGYGKSTEAGNPLIPVTFRIKNRISLVPGSFIPMYIKTASTQEVIAIPNTGIVEEMGNRFVFVQINPELFEKRPVETGATDGISTEILKGLEPGERVVSKGALMVKLAQSAGALDPHAGHVHSH